MPNCPRCLKSFAYASKLKEHLSRKTPCDNYDGKRAPICTRCNKLFSNQSHLTRHLKTNCHPKKATEANPKQCPHCKRIFARNGICKAHVERGCPSLKSAAGAGLREKELELERKEKALRSNAWWEKKRADEAIEAKRAEYEDYRKFYMEEQEKLEKRLAAAEAELKEQVERILRYEKEKLYLEATHRYDLREIDRLTALVGTGGNSATVSDGGMAAGRDIKNEITLNIYGGENFDLLQKPTFLTNIIRRLHLELGVAKSEGTTRPQLHSSMVNQGLYDVGKLPENKTLRGYDREADRVEVHEGEGEWAERGGTEVAEGYARRMEKELLRHREAGVPKMPDLTAEELREWALGEGAQLLEELAAKEEAAV